MAAPRAITFGVSRNHEAGVASWPEILARALSAGLDRMVVPLVARDYEQLLARVIAGDADLAWLPPLLHTRAVEKGARLVALPQRGGWLTFRSALLVRNDDPAKTPRDLRGARAAWRDRSSASGYLFPRLDLATLGAPPERSISTETFYGSIARAAEAVVKGEADLCTCHVSDVAARDPERARTDVKSALGPLADSLRVLHVTEPIPPDGFVVAAQLAGSDRERIREALLAMHTTEQGRKALREVLRADRLAPLNESLARSLRTWTDSVVRRG